MSNVTRIALRRPHFIRPSLPGKLKMPRDAQVREIGPVHQFALGLVWLAVASSAIVFTEPAPTDLLMMAVIVLLPVVGLAVFRPPLLVLGAILLGISAFGFGAAMYATDTVKASTHMGISLYLSLAAVVLGAFVARDPAAHTRLILRAYLAGALLASVAAIVGYFDVVPGAKALFTRFDRASGPFKDPNVFGPFLIAPIVYALHVWFNRPFLSGLAAIGALAVLSTALLLSFSRGAWIGTALAVSLYLYLTFVTTSRNLDRFRITALAFGGLVLAVGLLAAALQFDQISNIFSHRASLAQSYDVGPEGRFGGQLKALAAMLDNPLGIGALEFPHHYHHEDVHNVFLSIFLNSGWVGGFLFILLVVATLVLGFRHVFERTRTQGYFIIAIATLTATLLQGLVVDIDHWRHFYAMLGMTWALMAAEQTVVRAPRIVRDRRPLLMAPVIVLPPTRRKPRVVRRVAQIIELKPGGRPRKPHRPPRILQPIQPRRSARLLAEADGQLLLPFMYPDDNSPPS